MQVVFWKDGRVSIEKSSSFEKRSSKFGKDDRCFQKSVLQKNPSFFFRKRRPSFGKNGRVI